MFYIKKNPLLLTLVLMLGVFSFFYTDLPLVDRVSYFDFADKRSFLDIPNALDVLSNLAFLFVGIWGLIIIPRNSGNFSKTFLSFGICLSIASILTCIGSWYFHWTPNAETLVWDRLPMTIGFAAITGMIIGDKVNERIGLGTMAVFIPIGFLTVLGYSQQWFSLRPYIVLQFGSIVFIAAMISFIKSGKVANKVYWIAVGFYAIAKVLEVGDKFIFNASGLISGHSLKHFFAALAIFKLVSAFQFKKK